MTTTTTTTDPLTFDQAVRIRLAAAEQRQLGARLAAAVPRQLQMTAVPHEWYRKVGLSAVLGLAAGTTRPCPHLGRGNAGYGPMFCRYRRQPERGEIAVRPAPMEIQCQDCFSADAPRFGAVEELTCDHCAVYARGLVSGSIPFGPLMVMFGVCGTCAAELGMQRATAASEPSPLDLVKGLVEAMSEATVLALLNAAGWRKEGLSWVSPEGKQATYLEAAIEVVGAIEMEPRA